MEYKNLGRSGLQVSVVGLGSWLTFGNQLAAGESERLVHAAFARGVNLFDTADVYARGDGRVSAWRRSARDTTGRVRRD